VKPLSADDSVAVCHAKVGNCQALIQNPGLKPWVFFCLNAENILDTTGFGLGITMIILLATPNTRNLYYLSTIHLS
jgi:uncharacterized membrane protein YhfC